MEHKSPFTKEVYREWERLLLLQPDDYVELEPLVKQVEGWKSLYAKTYRNGAWLIPAPDAALVASLGVTIALRQRRFPDAAVLAQEYLDHPDAGLEGELSRIDSNHLTVRLGIALILSGKVDEGIARLTAELTGPQMSEIVRKAIVRNQLWTALRDLSRETEPDPRLANFIGFLLSDWKGNKGKARKARACATNRDLFELLDSTYPR